MIEVNLYWINLIFKFHFRELWTIVGQGNIWFMHVIWIHHVTISRSIIRAADRGTSWSRLISVGSISCSNFIFTIYGQLLVRVMLMVLHECKSIKINKDNIEALFVFRIELWQWQEPEQTLKASWLTSFLVCNNLWWINFTFKYHFHDLWTIIGQGNDGVWFMHVK